MGVGYILVNGTKQELISLAHLPVNTMREIAGNSVSASVTAWYLLNNPGDRISFVSDCADDWPFNGEKRHLAGFQDRTEAVIKDLIENGILEDHGRAWEDKDEPDKVFVRNIKNVWAKT